MTWRGHDDKECTPVLSDVWERANELTPEGRQRRVSVASPVLRGVRREGGGVG